MFSNDTDSNPKVVQERDKKEKPMKIWTYQRHGAADDAPYAA